MREREREEIMREASPSMDETVREERPSTQERERGDFVDG